MTRKEINMKKTLSLILAVILIIGMMPLQALAEGEPLTGDENVTLVGQWVKDSTTKENTKKTL